MMLSVKLTVANMDSRNIYDLRMRVVVRPSPQMVISHLVEVVDDSTPMHLDVLHAVILMVGVVVM
jgi:hypothetical protein